MEKMCVCVVVGGVFGVRSEGNTKKEMGDTGGTKDRAGLRQTKLEGKVDSSQNTGR